MTHREIINNVKNTFNSDIVDVYSMQDASDVFDMKNLTYPLVTFNITTPILLNNPTSEYTFTIVYADAVNNIDSVNTVHSDAIKCIKDFIASYDNNYGIRVADTAQQVELFVGEYKDRLAGAWANITLLVDTTDMNECNKIKI